jgi:hypothetical protein
LGKRRKEKENKKGKERKGNDEGESVKDSNHNSLASK